MPFTSSSPLVRFFFGFFLPSAPFLLIYLIGAILCLVRRRRHPPASYFGLAAFIILFMTTLLSITAQYWIIFDRPDMDRIQLYSSIITVFRVGSGVIGWVLLLIGYFGWRTPVILEKPYDDAAPGRRWGDG